MAPGLAIFEAEGGCMFEATDKAVEMIKEYLKEGNIKSSVRILMAGGG